MSRLIDRNKFIPNGFTFYQPETKWRPTRMASFETIVGEIIGHRNANPFLKEQHGWSVDPAVVRDELDAYNAKVCEQMGWVKYISGAPEPARSFTSAPQPTLRQFARHVAAGAETLVDWIKDGSEAVPREQAGKRAEVCVGCHFNMEGDLLSFFTRSASEAIRKTIQFKHDLQLDTEWDSKLGVCNVCSCPLKLKIHVPMHYIQQRIAPDVRNRLPEYCWIAKEWK